VGISIIPIIREMTVHMPVFKTLEKELEEGGLQGLTPIERMEPSAGMAVSVYHLH